MTREQLRQQKITEGWKVPAIDEWQLVSAVGLEPKKYDVNNVFNPNRESYGTATVVVYDEGTPSESAVGQDEWKVYFRDELNTFVRSMEKNTVWAVTVIRVHEQDLVAEVEAIIEANNTGTRKTYFIRKRSGNFEFIEIV